MTTYNAGSNRRFEVGRVIERTFGVLGAKLGQFLILGLLLVALPSILLEFGLRAMQAAAGGDGALTGFAPLQFLLSVASALASIALAYLMQAAVVHASVEDLKGRNASIGESVGASLRHVLPLIAMAILAAVGITLGLVLLIVPGVILAVLWSVIVPARVAEGRGIFESFRRSADLTKGSRFSIFLLFLVCGVIYLILVLVIGGIAAAAGLGAMRGAAADMGALTIVATVVSAFTSMIASIVGSVGVSAIYFELRGVREGVDREDLATIFS